MRQFRDTQPNSCTQTQKTSKYNTKHTKSESKPTKIASRNDLYCKISIDLF